jgi:hypothetical protein
MSAKPSKVLTSSMSRLQVEKELEQIKNENEVPFLSRKLALYRRLKELPSVPAKADRDPDCAYPC